MPFQEKDTTRDCFRFVDIEVTELETRLWRSVFAKKGSNIQLRHEIIHGDQLPLEDIEKYYNVDTIEKILIEITKFVYLIEEERFNKYKYSEEHAIFLEKLNRE